MLLCIDDEKYERILLNISVQCNQVTPKGETSSEVVYDDDYVNVSVRDEGVGIPKDKINVILSCSVRLITAFPAG